MNTLQSSLFSAAIAICALCVFLTTSGNSRLQGRYKYFVLYLVVEALAFTFEWLTLHPTSPAKSLWLGLLMGLSFFVAPFLWLFARDITEDQTPRIRSLPAHHFVIIATGLLLTLPLIQTTHLGPYYWNPDYAPSKTHNLFIHGTMLVCVILFLFQVPYYLRKCFRILAKHVDHSKALFSNIEDKSLNTLRLLAAVVLTKWFVSLLRVLYCVTLGADTGWGLLFSAMEVSVTVWALFFVMRQATPLSVDERKLVHDIFDEGAEGELDESSQSVSAKGVEPGLAAFAAPITPVAFAETASSATAAEFAERATFAESGLAWPASAKSAGPESTWSTWSASAKSTASQLAECAFSKSAQSGPSDFAQSVRPESLKSANSAELAEPLANLETKYARSSLDDATRSRIQRKLHEAMATSQLYRDSRLTLRRFCQQIKESPHYVSQVINQNLNTNFYDFVNLHRIQRAQQVLLTSPEKTVIEIALEVGFNSKSTFNAAFRRHTGATPTEHRNAHRAPERSDLSLVAPSFSEKQS